MTRLSSLLILAVALIHTSASANVSFEDLYRHANDSTTWLVKFRRDLHMNPEIGLETYRTSKRVLEELAQLGIQAKSGWAKDKNSGVGGAGIVFDMISTPNGEDASKLPTVLLRADMDALPINELTPVQFKSKFENKMHACGHDTHTSMLLGAVKLLNDHKDKWAGTVRIVFQPAEEIGVGSAIMIEEGMLEWNNKKVNSAFALHVWPMGETGNIVGAPGVTLAGGASFNITVTGLGGHVGAPAAATDAIVASAALIQNAQILSSRETFGQGTYRYGLISFGQINSSAGPSNVLPRQVTMSGYIRSASMDVVRFMQSRLEKMVKALSDTHRVTGEISFGHELVPTKNDPELISAHQELVTRASRTPAMQALFKRPGEYTFGMEDFGYVTQKVPSAFYILLTGSGHELPNHPLTNYSLHSEYFAMDERIIPRGAAFLASLAVDELERLQKLSSAQGSKNVEL